MLFSQVSATVIETYHVTLSFLSCLAVRHHLHHLLKESCCGFVPAPEGKCRCLTSGPFQSVASDNHSSSSSPSFLWMEPRASHVTDRPSTAELQSSLSMRGGQLFNSRQLPKCLDLHIKAKIKKVYCELEHRHCITA